MPFCQCIQGFSQLFFLYQSLPLVKFLFIPLQGFALRAIAKGIPEPAVGLAGTTVCTPRPVCTKKERKPRRREGDKCFFVSFFCPRAFFDLRCGFRRMGSLTSCSGQKELDQI